MIGNGISLSRAQARLEISGGNGYHNEAWNLPVDLARNTLRDYHPAFASWGFHLPFLFLTAGGIPCSFLADDAGEKTAKLLEQHRRVALLVSARDLESLGACPAGWPVSGTLRHATAMPRSTG